ncbi:hypothetical protein SLEP1_g42455 [Rubroshorea leprosula]|uniref:Uncharacterized protein n=1 Tax=Rubroshorea leprosula TaxID=152421 RepID=A0AAV5L9V6_9ROSI|nr:hypothetical protein SLEP1_g42455 [Rubroshorea leprosula]
MKNYFLFLVSGLFRKEPRNWVRQGTSRNLGSVFIEEPRIGSSRVPRKTQNLGTGSLKEPSIGLGSSRNPAPGFVNPNLGFVRNQDDEEGNPASGSIRNPDLGSTRTRMIKRKRMVKMMRRMVKINGEMMMPRMRLRMRRKKKMTK